MGATVVDERCIECGEPIGCEAAVGIMGEVGMRGMLHSTGCARNWWADHVLDPTPWRFVELV